MEVSSGTLEAVFEAVESAGTVTAFDVLGRSDGRALVQFETTVPLLLMAARDSGMPIATPFEVVDGEATWEVTASAETLSELGTQLEGLGLPFSVDHVREGVGEERLLTETRAELVRTAIREGYYTG